MLSFHKQQLIICSAITIICYSEGVAVSGEEQNEVTGIREPTSTISDQSR